MKAIRIKKLVSFLRSVMKDCVSCVNKTLRPTSDKDLGNPLLGAQESFQVKLRSGLAEKQQLQDNAMMMRSKRASSVQRQTDSLRRLAASRDVTPRLQTPRPTSSLLILADDRSIASESAIAGSMILPPHINMNTNPLASSSLQRRSVNISCDVFPPTSQEAMASIYQNQQQLGI